MSVALTCPRCGSRDLRRSRRRSVERLVSWLRYFPFRCMRCAHRFVGRAVQYAHPMSS